MPALTTAALIGAGSSLIGGGISAYSQQRSNRKNRQFTERMYNQQKQDNLDFWNQQNNYNSPQAQMKRYQQAGLNPALMYGQGNSGNAGAISTPSVQPLNNKAISDGNFVPQAVNQYYNTKLQNAQIDQVKAQTTATKQDAILKASQIGATDATTANTKQTTKGQIFDLKFKEELRNYSADLLKESVRQKGAQIDNTLTDTQKKKLMMAPDLEKTMVEIARQKIGKKVDTQKIKNMVQDLQLKKQEFELAKEGIYKSDPMWLRVLIQNLDSITQKFNKLSPFTGGHFFN